SPLRDKRVREALNLAIDRKELASTLFGGMADPGAVPFGLSWTFPDVQFKLTPDMYYAYDPARAKKLLADAGVAGGFPLENYAYQLPGLPEGKAMAEAVAGYWQQIGVQPKLVPVDYAAFRKKWIDRAAPGALGYYNMANRNWIGAFALVEKYTGPQERTAPNRGPGVGGEEGGGQAQAGRGEDRRPQADRLPPPPPGAPRRAARLPPHAVRHRQADQPVEPGLGDVRPQPRRAGGVEVACGGSS